MTFLPLELKTGPSGEACGMVVRDLLCVEALSPNTHCPSGLLLDDCNAAPRWLAMIRPLRPAPNHMGSSLPSKIGEHISPCFIHTLPFCADEITMTSTTRRDNPALRRCKAGCDASLVTNLAIATFAELGEAMRILQEREAQTSYRISDRYIDALLGFSMAGSSFVEVCSVRRDGVFLIFKLVETLRLRKLIAAHAIGYLDRFLNNLPSTLVKLTVNETSATQFRYVAIACVSIAAKMDDSTAPSLASLGRTSGEGKGSERRIRDMEAVVLQVLGWKLLGVTTSDFVDNMLAHLPLSGVPSPLVHRAHRRADELIQVILTEVEFLDFEQSIVGFCVMQCILDETLPLQAALLMAVVRTFLEVDTLAAQQCYKILMAFVAETLPRCSPTSSDVDVQESMQAKHLASCLITFSSLPAPIQSRAHHGKFELQNPIKLPCWQHLSGTLTVILELGSHRHREIFELRNC